MMNATLSLFRAISFAVCLLLGVVMNAQEVFTPNDRFPGVENKNLYEALVTLEGARPDLPDAANPNKVVRPLSEIYSLPENAKAIAVVLETAVAAKFSEQSYGIQRYFLGAIEAAIISGKSDHVPALKKLAHNDVKEVRNSVARWDSYYLSPSPSLEVLKECLLSAEALLPRDLPDQQTSQAPFDEFEDRVRGYCIFATPEQRTALAPMVDDFLKRYDDAKFRNYYAPRLKKMLSGEAFEHKVSQGNPQGMPKKPSGSPPSVSAKSTGTKQELPSTEPSSTPWFMWAVVIAAVIGLLWLLLKKRK